MPFDLMAHMNAMTRTVRNLERNGELMKAVVASCVYDTDAADLWDAVTSAERLRRWFSPVSGELKLGGRYQVENNAGGTITECEPNRRFAATWEFMGGMSWITVTLTPEADGTRLELEHVAPVDPHWQQFGPGAVGVGWDLGFMGLAIHIADPGADKPKEAEAGWFETPEAKAFIRGTAEGWGIADTAAGENRDDAMARAETTRKFYSGEMPPPGV